MILKSEKPWVCKCHIGVPACLSMLSIVDSTEVNSAQQPVHNIQIIRISVLFPRISLKLYRYS